LRLSQDKSLETPSLTLPELRRAIRVLSDPKRIAGAQRFFKTQKGQYGYGDKFLGLTVPQCRTLAKTYRHLPLVKTLALLHSPFHDDRLIALLILIAQYHKGNAKTQKTIYNAYLRSTQWINNWDLVDTSVYKIVGRYLLHRSHAPLLTLAQSKNLWQRRIAIVSTMTFINDKHYGTTLTIATILLNDPHDLIHKAVGWMLREVGKRDVHTLKHFLDDHAAMMPRTMLRYAIEKLTQRERLHYLHQPRTV